MALRLTAAGGLCIVMFIAAAQAADPATTSTSSTPPTTSLALDQSNPKSALKTFARALDAGDRAIIRDMLQADTDAEKNLAEATADMADAAAQLRRAAIDKFGAEKARPLGVDTAATTQALKRIDAASEKVEGDFATLRTPNEDGPPLKLSRKDGKWRLPVSEMSKDVQADDLQRNIADMKWQSKQLRDLAADVAAGKFATATEAREMLDRRILERTLPPLKSSTTAPRSTQKQ